MHNACANTVENVQDSCGGEQLLYTHNIKLAAGLWVAAGVLQLLVRMATTRFTTAILRVSSLFPTGFSPVSTGPTTRTIFWKTYYC